MDYAAAGVDTAAGDRAVELMKDAVARTHGPEVLGGAGGFAGMFDGAALLGMKRPVLTTSTDGIGTKIAIARAMGIHDTVGQDLVAMVVDDLVVSGARPLFMTDYIACGKVIPERIAEIVRGIAEACAATGTALVGGETAEHPGLMAEDEYDVAGAATGVVDYDEIRGPHRINGGEVLVALASSGLHSNGYSLVRKLTEGMPLDGHVAELGRTLGEELLEPTRLYAKLCLEILDDVHAFSHVTGGGLAANVARILPEGTFAIVDRAEITPPPVFQLMESLSGAGWDAIEDALNLGVGMVAAVQADAAARVIETSQASGVDAWEIGQVFTGSVAPANARLVSGTKGIDGGTVAMVGSYS